MLLIFITFLFIFLPRSVTSTWSHYCHKFPWIWVSSRKRPPTPACGCKTPPRRWRQRAGMAAKRTRINCCPTPAPRAVFIYTIDPLSNMELARLFSRSGASATSSATSASPTPSASQSTSRPSPSTPSTPWRVRTIMYYLVLCVLPKNQCRNQIELWENIEFRHVFLISKIPRNTFSCCLA